VISLRVLTPAELALRIGGTIVAVALAVATAVWEVVLTPWYVMLSGHVVRVPAAPVLAVLCNVGLLWFTRSVTGKLGLAVFPALAWLAIMVIAGNVTSDGDLLVTSNWVGVATILLGMAGWALPAYRMVLKRQNAVIAANPATVATGPKAVPGRTAATKPVGEPVRVKQAPAKQAPAKPAAAKSPATKAAAPKTKRR
jgi:hypothetical protein